MARAAAVPARTRADEIALLRLAAHHIAGAGWSTATDAVRAMTAMQAQDYKGALTSVALRTNAGSIRDVEAALDAGDVVRSWPMRGTLHVVAAEDLGWMLDLLSGRILASAPGRQAQLGIDAALLDQARQLAVTALTEAGQLRRADLIASWERNGVSTTGQRGYHLLWYLAQTGVVCFGPVQDGEQLIVLVDDWIPHPRRLGREEALGELARRYFSSHGPATAKDFARWANLVMADVRTGIELARPDLVRIEVGGVEVGGVEYFMDPLTPELLDGCRAAARGVFLLPGFDEFMLGYADRSAMLPAEFANRIVPGGNGVFRPTIVSDGQVVGTWTHTGRGLKQTIASTPFTSFSGDVVAAISRVYATLP